MKKAIIVTGIFFITAVVVGFYPVYNSTANAKTKVTDLVSNNKPKIQMAILLDTSSSMSGLIDQARNQLWQAVNEFARTKKNGVTPTLEVAVFEYGNSGLPAKSGYIRQVTGLTSELDQVSEGLFSLTTNGGDEYCGYVIKTAVAELEWSDSNQDIKAIFIAGNEPFTQGPVPFQEAVSSAKKKGITVNTIHAGGYDSGVQTGWKDGALLASGNYMSIDHNHRVAHVNAPQDKRIAELNARLNQTYIPYGTKGKEKALRQQEQDVKSGEISSGLLAKRAQSKASKMYNNASWDLIDAMESGDAELDKLPAAQLPPEMRKMDKAKQKEYVENKTKEREKIKQEITVLSKDRNSYVAEQQRAAAKSPTNTVNDALITAIRAEAKKKAYVFQEK